MPDGSPIDQWWKSHTPPVVTTSPATSVHAERGGGDFRPYCGHRGRKPVLTAKPEDVTCSACVAAIRADMEASR